MTGVEVLQELQGDPHFPLTHFIMLTARTGSADQVLSLDSGASDYVVKPFEMPALLARIKAGLRKLERQESLVRSLQAKNRTLEQDMEEAREAQQRLLPQGLPRTARARFEFLFVPCHYVSGDALSVFQLDEDNIAFWMVDVCGHGVAAVMGSVSILRLLSPETNITTPLLSSLGTIRAPGEVVEALNRQMHPTFFTFFYGIFNLESQRLSYCRAGHPPPLLLRHDGVLEPLQMGGIVAGLNRHAVYQTGYADLQSGDRLFVFSDGVTEAITPAKEAFGTDRLQRVLGGTRGRPLLDALENVEEEVRQFKGGGSFADDFSILAMEVFQEVPDSS